MAARTSLAGALVNTVVTKACVPNLECSTTLQQPKSAVRKPKYKYRLSVSSNPEVEFFWYICINIVSDGGTSQSPYRIRRSRVNEVCPKSFALQILTDLSSNSKRLKWGECWSK